MNFPIYLAKRYIKSRRGLNLLSFISLFTIGGIALGVAVLIIALSVLKGFEDAVAEKIVNLNSHIYITGFSDRMLDEPEFIIPVMREVTGDNYENISPFISGNAIIRSRRLSEGVKVIGINPEDEAGLAQYIVSGAFSFDSLKGKPAVIIGKKLADKLFVKPGDKITFFSLPGKKPPSAENPPMIKQFIVSALYESGMAAYDDIKVYIDFESARKLFMTDGKVSGYNIRLTNISGIDSLAADLQDILGYPYNVRTIYQEFQSIFTWLDLQKEPVPLILGLIVIVAAFNIIGTILMLVLERTVEIGVLRAMGMTRKQVTKIFIIAGMTLTVTGILIGNLLAFLISLAQMELGLVRLPSSVYFMSVAPVSIEPAHYILVSVFALIISLGSSWIPGRIAARMDPVKALRFG